MATLRAGCSTIIFLSTTTFEKPRPAIYIRYCLPSHISKGVVFGHLVLEKPVLRWKHESDTNLFRGYEWVLSPFIFTHPHKKNDGWCFLIVHHHKHNHHHHHLKAKSRRKTVISRKRPAKYEWIFDQRCAAAMSSNWERIDLDLSEMTFYWLLMHFYHSTRDGLTIKCSMKKINGKMDWKLIRAMFQFPTHRGPSNNKIDESSMDS